MRQGRRSCRLCRGSGSVCCTCKDEGDRGETPGATDMPKEVILTRPVSQKKQWRRPLVRRGVGNMCVDTRRNRRRGRAGRGRAPCCGGHADGAEQRTRSRLADGAWYGMMLGSVMCCGQVDAETGVHGEQREASRTEKRTQTDGACRRACRSFGSRGGDQRGAL
jgi:hypothetical protein